jgi:hypothetical protein
MPSTAVTHNHYKKQTPEEQELTIKQAELAKLQQEIAQRELDLSTLEIELRAFEIRYLRTVGSRYAALDEIEARIAEHIASLNPENATAQNNAKAAREQAAESAQRSRAADSSQAEPEFKPSDDLKKLYREVAKQIHPDLSEDEAERLRRERLMTDANIAFEKGDAERLRQILHEWESSPESVKGEGPAAELIRTIRKIAQIVNRLRAIEIRTMEIINSDLWRLKQKAEESKAAGRDLLAQMAAGLDGRIAAAQIELEVALRTTTR